jgi:hypothetical protein
MNHRMKWVTWEQIGVDRMGCGWLIRRFIDPAATIAFVPVDTRELPPDHEPFDIPGVRLSHHQGHCTFHGMLRAYQLTDPVLYRIAAIIDEADLAHDVMLEPIAAGLDALCQGLRRISPDDDVAMQHGYIVYEALYAHLAAGDTVNRS